MNTRTLLVIATLLALPATAEASNFTEFLRNLGKALQQTFAATATSASNQAQAAMTPGLGGVRKPEEPPPGRPARIVRAEPDTTAPRLARIKHEASRFSGEAFHSSVASRAMSVSGTTERAGRPYSSTTLVAEFCNDTRGFATSACARTTEAMLQQDNNYPYVPCSLHPGVLLPIRLGKYSTADVCAETGMLSTAWCPLIATESFEGRDDEPTQRCTTHALRGARAR